MQLHFATCNAAYREVLSDGSEQLDIDAVVETLRNIAAQVEAGCESGTIRDANGNRVGTFDLNK